MTRKIVLAAMLTFTATPALAHNPPFVYRPKPTQTTTNLGMAQKYEREATRWRAEAAYHRQMAADYKRFSKSPVNPAIPKMEQHCDAIVQAAEQRVAEAEGLATEYRLRAKAN